MSVDPVECCSPMRNQFVSKGRGRVGQALAMTEHVPGRVERQEFHHELGAIEAKVIELFTMVADDVPRAGDALLNGNSEVARALAERDRVIDALYPQIEELADREILLQQPAQEDESYLSLAGDTSPPAQPQTGSGRRVAPGAGASR